MRHMTNDKSFYTQNSWPIWHFLFKVFFCHEKLLSAYFPLVKLSWQISSFLAWNWQNLVSYIAQRWHFQVFCPVDLIKPDRKLVNSKLVHCNETMILIFLKLWMWIPAKLASITVGVGLSRRTLIRRTCLCSYWNIIF